MHVSEKEADMPIYRTAFISIALMALTIFLHLAGISNAESYPKVTGEITTDVCEENEVTMQGGEVICDDEYGVFTFANTDTLWCRPDDDVLKCTTSSATAPEATTFTIAHVASQKLWTNTLLDQVEQVWDLFKQFAYQLMQNGDVGSHTLTGFYDCGAYSIRFSTLQDLGGGYATCEDNMFAISMPIEITQIACVSNSTGWGCSGEGFALDFFLLP